MLFDLEDDIEGLLDDLEEWANQQVRKAEDDAQKLDVVPQFYTPQDFWANNNNIGEDDYAWEDDHQATAHIPNNSNITSHQQQQQFSILKTRSDACDALLAHLDRALSDLDSIETQHKLVSEKTHSLHDVCKRLLAEQTRLDKVVAGIQAPMAYFMSLDEISPRFGMVTNKTLAQSSSSKQPVVLHPDDQQFKRDLARLDECIHFISSHAHYHDAKEYLDRFVQVQIQGMRMIETWAGQEISRLENNNRASKPPAAASSSSFLDDSSLYFRFVEKGKVLRSSISELEKHPKVAVEAMHSLITQLCDLRLKLLQNLVKQAPEVQAHNNNSGMVSIILLGSEFLGRVCAAEHSVVSSFFSLPAAKQILAQHHHRGGNNNTPVGDEDEESFRGVAFLYDDRNAQHAVDPFFDLLESLSSCLFDSVRPLIVKENDLETLCDASSAVESAIQELDMRLDSDAAEPLESVLARIALDLQERICFCFVRIVREDISQPKLVNQWMEQNMLKTWFPSLEITLSTLSKIYRTVDSNVFEHLATEAVSACTKSLCETAVLISKRKSADEGDLFLIQHLLILREQISPFRAVLTARERKLDFTPTSRALGHLLRLQPPTGFMNLLRFAGPTFHETDLNTKKELDMRLRHASESFILRVSKRALGPLLEFVDRSQAYLQSEDANWEGLCAQDFASLPALQVAIKFCETNTLKEISMAKELANQFLTNPQTRGVLFHAIETNAFKIVTTASNFAMDMFKEEVEWNDRLRELVRVVGAMKTLA